MGSIEAVLLCSAGLALGVLFGDPEEALVLARQAVALAGEVPAYRLKALLRLMVVLQYRGMLELPESQLIVREARDLARKSGDVLARYSIENNLAVAILDAGDLEAAELQMARAKSLAGSAEMDLNRCIQANNRAELALAKREFRLAEAAYAEALSYTGPTTPVYLIDLVNAGMGLCALEAGNLSEAKRMEGKLSESPSRWHFDPTTILAFRVRLLRLGQSQAEAIELLEQAARDVDGRLVLAWLKIRALQVALLLRHDTKVAGVLAQESLRRAEELQLVHRVQEFRLLLARTRSALRSKS